MTKITKNHLQGLVLSFVTIFLLCNICFSINSLSNQSKVSLANEPTQSIQITEQKSQITQATQNSFTQSSLFYTKVKLP